MQLRKTILASVFSAALALSAAACGTAENTQSVCSAAASEHVAETPTPSPEATATASPTAEPTVKSTASPAPESNEVSENAEITAELEAMAPLLEAHILAQMNGMAFDANDPVYFWQTAAFAVDNCGMTFYSAETTGSALVLSRGVIEEIVSGLFESAANEDLPDIPDSLSGEISYECGQRHLCAAYKRRRLFRGHTRLCEKRRCVHRDGSAHPRRERGGTAGDLHGGARAESARGQYRIYI